MSALQPWQPPCQERPNGFQMYCPLSRPNQVTCVARFCKHQHCCPACLFYKGLFCALTLMQYVSLMLVSAAQVMQVLLCASGTLLVTPLNTDNPLTCLVMTAGIPANPGRPLIDFAAELPPPAALAIPAGGYGGPGSKQPQSIKQALEASDQMFAAKEREANKVSVVPSRFA